MLKNTVINSGEIYIGRNAGEPILKDISTAQSSIKIITPYISSEFIDLLIKRSQEGIEVSLILSDDFVSSDTKRYEIFKNLIRQNRHTDDKKKKRRRIALSLISIGYLIATWCLVYGFQNKIPLYWGCAYAFPLLIIFNIFFYKIRIYSYTYECLINFSVTMTPYSDSNRFNAEYYLTHAKVFIIDNKLVYLGSMNFTKMGFYKNYESRIKVNDPNVAQSTSEEFNYLYSNPNTFYLNLNDLKKVIYSEPPN